MKSNRTAASEARIDTRISRLYKKGMFGISGEHLLVLGIVLLIFGPRRLPELGNTMGKAIRNFKDALSGVEEAKFRRVENEKAEAKAASAPAQAAQASSPAPEAVSPQV